MRFFALALLLCFPALPACGSDELDGGDDGGAAGATGTAGNSSAGGSGAPGGGCTSARRTLLGEIDRVSSGVVSVLDDQDGVRVLFVDASAGGFMGQTTNPFVYLSLADAARAELTDPEALASSDWDLAFKRDVIRVNGGDSGPGEAETARLEGVAFDALTAGDADGANFVTDDFLDAACEPLVDATGKPLTGFSDWYLYDPDTMVLTPAPVVFLVRTPAGAMYKLEIESYYATPSGAEGMTGARYRLRYAEL